MSFDARRFRNLFPEIKTNTYLNTASMAPAARPVVSAMQTALHAWKLGQFDSGESFRITQETCECFGRLIGAAPNSVALVPTAAAGAATVATSLKHTARRNEIVVCKDEFRSNLFPWQALQKRGFEIREVDGLDESAVLSAIKRTTVLVAVSQVNFMTGFRINLRKVSDQARKVGARLFVDATQALGVINLNVQELEIDYVAAHGYKWLLGPRGLAWLYVRPSLAGSMVPLAPSWASARDPNQALHGGDYRYDLQPNVHRLDFSPPWFLPAGALAALNLLNAQDRPGFEAHCLRLAERVRSELRMNRSAAAGLASHIIGIKMSKPQEAKSELLQMGISVGNRGNYLRVGFHGFNTDKDVDRLLSGLLIYSQTQRC